MKKVPLEVSTNHSTIAYDESGNCLEAISKSTASNRMGASYCWAQEALGNACLGPDILTTMVMALDPHGDIAGLASSLGGTSQMLAGGVMITAAGPFLDGTATPMVAAIALCAVISIALSRWLFAGGRLATPNAAA